MSLKPFAGLLFILFGMPAFSQSAADTSFLTLAKQNTAKLYQKALGAQARLYNGSKYAEPEITYEQHPYFLSEDWVEGSVFYDGEYFHDVPLLYDIWNDALITEHLPSGNAIQLIREKLQHFSLAGHHFEKIDNETVSNSLPKTGFYEILYGGTTMLVAWRQKFSHEKIESLHVEVEYEEKNRYFILRNGVFFPVRSKASVLKLLGNKKHELRRFLKQSNIAFAIDRESAMKSLTTHYDTLQ